jgi:hypothetical protein
MEATTNKETYLSIPGWMLYLGEKIAPQFDRDILLGDLRSLECNTRTEYAWITGKLIGGVIKARMVESFNIWLVVGELFCLYIGLCIADVKAPLLPFAVFAVLLQPFLRIRDAYAYPADGSADEILTDGVLAAAWLMMIQITLSFFAPTLALPMKRFLLGLAAIAGVSEWRGIFRRETPRDPELQELQDRITAIWHIYAFWLLGTFPILAGMITAVPGGNLRDFLIGFGSPISMLVAARLRKRNFVSIWEWEPLSIRDPEVDELTHARAVLFFRDTARRFPLDLLAEANCFVVMSIPMWQAIAMWLSRNPAAANLDWLQLAFNLVGMLVAIVLWIQIKKMSRTLADRIQQRIDKVKAATT